VSDTKLEEVVKRLALDLDEEGWDQPARLYLVVGSLEDPMLVLLGIQAEGHPYDLLEALPPVPRELVARGVLGLALAMESWVLRPTDEMREEVHATATRIYEEESARGVVPVDLTLEAWLEASWDHYRHGIPPSQHPDRREARLVHMRTLDGRTLVVMHYRDGEELLLDSASEDHGVSGRMEEQLQRLTSEIEARN
jgi:hypothetical protein